MSVLLSKKVQKDLPDWCSRRKGNPNEDGLFLQMNSLKK